MPRPTVWVVKEQVKSSLSGPVPMDYTPAYKFGDLKFITEFDLPVHVNSSVARKWYEDTLNFAKAYDPERDFIILTGSPLAIFMVGHVLAYCTKTPRVLVWRREQGQYVVYDPLDTLELMTAGVSLN